MEEMGSRLSHEDLTLAFSGADSNGSMLGPKIFPLNKLTHPPASPGDGKIDSDE